MSKLKKILKTIAVFVVIMLLISFIFSIINLFRHEITESEVISKTGVYFLYTIGYGSLDDDAGTQNVLAMIGLIALALMSTYLTINLFWRLDDVKLSKQAILNDDILSFEFSNAGRSICDVKASFVVYDAFLGENIGEPKEYSMPVIISKSKWNLKVSLKETFWYKAIYSLLSNKDRKLYCTYSFVDTKNGQNSIRVQEIAKENIINNNEPLKYTEFIKPVIINSKNLLLCENNSKIILKPENGFMNMNYEINSNAPEKSFAMCFYDFKNNNLNLGKFNKQSTHLEFSAVSSKKLRMNFEIKFLGGSQITRVYELNENPQNIVIPLSEISDDMNLENVTEICYTIFKEENLSNNDIKVSDLRIVTL